MIWQEESIPAVRNFSLKRYLGRWYEIARLPHRFERGMSASGPITPKRRTVWLQSKTAACATENFTASPAKPGRKATRRSES